MDLESADPGRPLGAGRGGRPERAGGPDGRPRGEARVGGRAVRLLKVLLTSACERDCYYCPFRAGRFFRRATFQPDERIRLVITLDQRGQIDGLFLSSGIIGGGIRTQDRLLAVAEQLRRRFGYRGYLHLKRMPGVEAEQVREAMRWADRVSIDLKCISPPSIQAGHPYGRRPSPPAVLRLRIRTVPHPPATEAAEPAVDLNHRRAADLTPPIRFRIRLETGGLARTGEGTLVHRLGIL
ncbi:MAG: hypothetical protein C4313_00185 [Thermoflexus sp.]|uniref:hypothetical protein n=1 Tax=Thermoflexus sp. TaxID=1969742 RepID=UPI0033166370